VLDFTQGFYGGFNRVVVVADEQAVLIDVIRVFQAAVDRVVEVFKDFIFGKVA
jgi:hypothetical protein